MTGVRIKGSRYSHVEKLHIIDLYNKVKSISKLEREYGYPHTSVCKILNDYNVDRFIKCTASSNYSKRSYKDNFNNLSEEQKGYICGLIAAADGYLDPSRKRVEISLCSSDKSVIDWLSKSLVSGNELKVHCRKPRTTNNSKTLQVQDMYRVSAVLPDLYSFCTSIGIVPKKTFNFPLDLSKCSKVFKLYFLRGLIDGDGSIKISDYLTNCEIRVVSADPTPLYCIQSEFGGSIYSHIQKTGTRLYYISFTGKKGKLLAKYLPKSPYMMTRKTDKLNTYLEVRQSTRLSSAKYQKSLDSLEEKLKCEV